MPGKVLRTPAYILTTINHGEIDKILRLFTLEYGKLSVIAKGARKSKRRFLNCLENFYLIDTIILAKKEDQTLYFLDSARLICDYANLQRDLGLINMATFVMELVNYWCPELEVNKAIFEDLRWIMDIINTGKVDLRFMIFFHVLLLREMGIFPHFEGCSRCSGEFNEGAWFSEFYKGNFYCKKCKDESAKYHLSLGAIRTFMHILTCDRRRLGNLRPQGSVMNEMLFFLRNFNREHGDRDFYGILLGERYLIGTTTVN